MASACVPGCLGGASSLSAARIAGPSALNAATVVVAATGEPSSLVPPLVYETVARDISDQMFERLAYLSPRGSPIELECVPAAAWLSGGSEWIRSTGGSICGPVRAGRTDGRSRPMTWCFPSMPSVIRPWMPARGRTSPGRCGRVRRTPPRYGSPLPSHRLSSCTTPPIMCGSFRGTSGIRSPVVGGRRTPTSLIWSGAVPTGSRTGSGAAILRWPPTRPGSGRDDQPAIRRAIWRFAPDPDATLNLLLSHEADLMETVGSPDRVQRVAGDTSFRLVTYPAAVYGFLAFRVADHAGRPHPVLGDRDLRRALAQAVDRPTLARAVFGEGTKPPPGPMSQLLWIWDDAIGRWSSTPRRAREAVAGVKKRGGLGTASTSLCRPPAPPGGSSRWPSRRRGGRLE